MKSTFVVLLLVLAAFAAASPSKSSVKEALKPKPCIKQCADDYTPVCGGGDESAKPISFGNECVLSNYNCENGKNLKMISKGECPGGGGVRLS